MRKIFFLIFFMVIYHLSFFSTEYYISVNRGKGKDATKEKPASDLGNIIEKLQPGDIINIAQGQYLGRGKNGCDFIEVPVKIFGGWNDDFTKRDPWSEYKTVFSGVNSDNPNFDFRSRITVELHIKYNNQTKFDQVNNVIIDGIIIDNAGRNQYQNEKQLKIIRPAAPSLKKSQTPGTPGIKITLGKYCNADVINCVVINCALASADGAISVAGNKFSRIKITNNIIINNSGNGIYPMSLFKPATSKPNWNELPDFEIKNNTVLFSWKPGVIDEFGGSSIRIDDYTAVTLKNNVLAFNDMYGIEQRVKYAKVTLIGNLITANRKADYIEWNTEMKIGIIDDEANSLEEGTTGNINETININVPKEWSSIYMARPDISRSDLEKNIQSDNSSNNILRSMLGLPVQANTIKDVDEVLVHRILLDKAIDAGMARYKEIYGSKKPEL